MGWLPPQVTQLFDQSVGEYGQDYAVPVGSPIYSPVAGVFSTERKGKSAWGNRGIVHTTNGLSFAVGHLTSFVATAGQKVKAGDLIGYSGGALSDPNSGNTSGPHVEVQFFKTIGAGGGSLYVDPKTIPGLAAAEKVIFGASPSAQTNAAVGQPSGTADPLNPLDGLTGALKSFNDFIGRAVWLAVGVGLIFAGLLLLVFEDFESAGKQVAKTVAANPEVLAA